MLADEHLESVGLLIVVLEGHLVGNVVEVAETSVLGGCLSELKSHGFSLAQQ